MIELRIAYYNHLFLQNKETTFEITRLQSTETNFTVLFSALNKSDTNRFWAFETANKRTPICSCAQLTRVCKQQITIIVLRIAIFSHTDPHIFACLKLPPIHSVTPHTIASKRFGEGSSESGFQPVISASSSGKQTTT